MIQPYWGVNCTIQEVVAKHSLRADLPDTKDEIKTGGRIIGRRKAGSGLMFLDLESNGNTVQVMLDQQNLQRDFAPIQQACPRGAIVGIGGFPSRTKAGEFTVAATEFAHLAECPKNLPMMNWTHKKTLKDSEKRFQQRYLDFIVNSELKSFFVKRAQIMKYLRRFFDDRNFLEVETPILNAQAGGALAKPFLTRSDTLK